MTTKSAQKDLAVAAVKVAADALQREEARLAETNAAIERLTSEVEAADPDDEKLLGKLVAQRDAARGRAEALAPREEKARSALESAEKDFKAAERAQLEAEVQELDTRIEELDGQLLQAARVLQAKIADGARELRVLVGRAATLEAQLGVKRDPMLDLSRSRGSRFVKASSGRELFTAAEVEGSVRETADRARALAGYTASTTGAEDAAVVRLRDERRAQ